MPSLHVELSTHSGGMGTQIWSTLQRVPVGQSAWDSHSTFSIHAQSLQTKSSGQSEFPVHSQPPWHVLSMQSWPSAQSRSVPQDRKSTRLNSSHVRISYAVF